MLTSSHSHLDDQHAMPSAVTQQPSLPPFHMHSASSSTSESHTSGAADPKKKTGTKRRRPQDGTSDSADSAPQPQPRTREGPKKKKANRACFHCQKAHLTCDDARPCARCVKRGMAANCTEGHRKKAKYLLDEEELEALKRAKSAEGSSKDAESAPASQPQSEPQFVPPDPMFPSYTPAAQSYALGSEGANLEYSILSAILGNSPDSNGAPATGSPSAAQAQPAAGYNGPSTNRSLVGSPWSDSYAATSQHPGNAYAGASNASPSTYADQASLAIQPSDTSLASSARTLSQDYLPAGSGGYPPTSQFTPGQGHPPSVNVPQPAQMTYPDYSAPTSTQPSPPSATSNQRYSPYMQRAQAISSSMPGAMRSDGGAVWGNQVGVGAGSAIITNAQGGAAVYQAVTKPYDYTEGYHFLMKHLPTRFDKNDILRIVRALAIFRPSLIALQMPLSEEDEVFVEKCFQRSLIELDKLVSFSGTPTVAWRRTGEICLVGPEFCMLTGWEKEELIGRRKYIYELFENQSVVEYWENFANHAFENTTQSVYSHCVLLKPSGAPVPCTFCFSIRRDIMDLPSLVIGQWLPLL
ncbi:hypothetical protein WOLCODRAFT_138591 [Wolfiporia cocos MD-104 SS10]|uniref:Transcription activator of gluconeogenesis ERT1 n=1 Tax=Wolfiporia cocos (strain MD-104) TaxID=742152 RepID=A0A2H3JNP5_WOLCO|nr:hypothetical protein WOLCODRAFT_138591 [Wolfiporia cocos MD-104 SS10]